MKKGYFDGSSPDWIVNIQDKKGNRLDFGKDKKHYARDKSDPDKKLDFKITKLVWAQQTDKPEKINFIAQIQWQSGRIDCWSCYYIFNRYGKWAFGQFGIMIPTDDFRELHEYAHEKGIL